MNINEIHSLILEHRPDLQWNTAMVYATGVSGLLGKGYTGDGSPESIHALGYSIRTSTLYGSGWRLFRTIAGEGKFEMPQKTVLHQVPTWLLGAHEAMPSPRSLRDWYKRCQGGEDLGEAGRRAFIPKAVIDCIVVLTHFADLEDLPYLEWDDVKQRANGDYHGIKARLPARRREIEFLFPLLKLDLVVALRAWAAPGDIHAPLIPMTRGDHRPMPLQILKWCMQAHRNEGPLVSSTP